MRGRLKIQKELIISGVVLLLYEDDTDNALIGDLMLYINDEPASFNVEKYYQPICKSFFKMEIFDGKNWCLVDMNDFFESRENHFNKKEAPIDVYENCKEILEQKSGTILYKTYRNHYSTQKYEREGYKGKKNEKYLANKSTSSN